MARSRSGRGAATGAGPGRGRDDDWRGYLRLSTRPLHVLCFLAPLIVLYEVGTVLYLTDRGRGVVETVSAQSILARFFEVFGVASLYLPGIALGTVLLLWHLLERDRWRVQPGVLAGMLCESLLWTVPLLVLGLLMQGGRSGGQPGPAAAMALPAALEAHSAGARVTLSVGAGLYEELLFRLIIIAGLHLVLVDVAGLRNGPGYLIAAVVSAIAFAMYHDVTPPGGPTNYPLAMFYGVAGLYFAGLFVLRGFGIVVMVHTLYDVLVLVVIAPR